MYIIIYISKNLPKRNNSKNIPPQTYGYKLLILWCYVDYFVLIRLSI